MNPGDFALCMDIGGSFIRIGYGKTNGDILKHRSYASVPSGEYDPGPEVLLETATQCIDDFLTRESLRIEDLSGLGVSIGGQIDSRNGVIRDTTSQHPLYKDFPIAERLKQSYSLKKVSVENDAKAAALGELVCGSGKNLQNFIYLGIGTGIGGALVFDGSLYHGANGFSGHIGQYQVALTSESGEFEGFSSIESIASGSGIACRGNHLLVNYQKTILSAPVQTADIFLAEKQKDHLAIRVLDDATTALAGALSSLIYAINPEVVIIGGGVALKNPEWVKNIVQVFQKITLPPFKQTRFITAKLGEEAGLIGALLSLSENYK